MRKAEAAFLRLFFGPENALSLTGMNSEASAELQSWVDNYRLGGEIRPLPRITGSKGSRQTRWYVLVDDPRVAAVAREEVRAFIGRSYSDFDPLEDRFDPLDPVDREILQVHPASFRFTVRTATRKQVPEVRRLLQTWLDLRARRPVRKLTGGSSVADHLYSFEEALRLGRWTAAEEWLKRLEQTGLLTEGNTCGLEILLADARGRSEAVWENRGFDQLVAKGAPRRVQLAMLRSAYRSLLGAHESSQDAKAALETFKGTIIPRSRPMLAVSVGVATPEAAVLLFLAQLISDSPDGDLVSAARSRAERLGADPSWLALLQQASGVELSSLTEAVVGDLDEAMRAFNRNNLDLAWSLASASQPSWDRAVLLLRTASEADSVAWAGEAVEAFKSANETLPEAPEYGFAQTLVETLERRFQDPATAPGEPIPSGWVDWASRLGRPGAWPAGVKLAEAGMVEWPGTTLAGEGLSLFAGEVGGVHDDNAPILRRTIPYLLGALDALPSNEPGLGEVLDTLLRVTMLDESPGDSLFPSITDLVERRFQCGISDLGYKALLADIRDAVTMHGAQESLDSLVDLFDVLERYRCPHPTERREAGAAIVAVAGRSLHKMDLTQLVLIRDLARALEIALEGLAERIEAIQLGSGDEEPPLDLSYLSKRLVMLYSLDAGALQRAKQILEATVPGMAVKTLDDKVATDSLSAAAKSADLVVVAHRSSTHAATDAIQAIRAGELVYAEGKGSSSLVRAVLEWAEGHVLA